MSVPPAPGGRCLGSSSCIHLTVPSARLSAGEQSFELPTWRPQRWLSIRLKTRLFWIVQLHAPSFHLWYPVLFILVWSVCCKVSFSLVRGAFNKMYYCYLRLRHMVHFDCESTLHRSNPSASDLYVKVIFSYEPKLQSSSTHSSLKVSAVLWISFSDIILITITVIQQNTDYCNGFHYFVAADENYRLLQSLLCVCCFSYVCKFIQQSDNFSQTGPKNVGFSNDISSTFSLIFVFLWQTI